MWAIALLDVCLLRHIRVAESEPYCHSILFVCLSVIPRPTAYHDWSITTKFGRQVYTCPRTRVSLFGSPTSHTFGARGKNMQNFAYFQRVFLPLRTWRIVPYDLSVCLSVCLSWPRALQKWLNWSRCHLGGILMWSKEPCIRCMLAPPGEYN